MATVDVRICGADPPDVRVPHPRQVKLISLPQRRHVDWTEPTPALLTLRYKTFRAGPLPMFLRCHPDSFEYDTMIAGLTFRTAVRR